MKKAKETKPQYLVKEKTVVPLNMKNFKENEKASQYLQQDVVWNKVKNNLPSNSGLALKNTSINDSPADNDDI
jgi:hypothetical protein